MFNVWDVIHVVAAITLVGDIILCCDDPYAETTYFDDLDRDGKQAAEDLFPELKTSRIFVDFTIRDNTLLYWCTDHAKRS